MIQFLERSPYLFRSWFYSRVVILGRVLSDLRFSSNLDDPGAIWGFSRGFSSMSLDLGFFRPAWTVLHQSRMLFLRSDAAQTKFTTGACPNTRVS